MKHILKRLSREKSVGRCSPLQHSLIFFPVRFACLFDPLSYRTSGCLFTDVCVSPTIAIYVCQPCNLMAAFLLTQFVTALCCFTTVPLPAVGLLHCNSHHHFLSFGESNYWRPTQFPLFTCCSSIWLFHFNLTKLCLLSLSLLYLQHITWKNCAACRFQDWGCVNLRVIQQHIDLTVSVWWRLIALTQICASLIITKSWKQSPVGWFLESLQLTYSV